MASLCRGSNDKSELVDYIGNLDFAAAVQVRSDILPGQPKEVRPVLPGRTTDWHGNRTCGALDERASAYGQPRHEGVGDHGNYLPTIADAISRIREGWSGNFAETIAVGQYNHGGTKDDDSAAHDESSGAAAAPPFTEKERGQIAEEETHDSAAFL